ncbi:MAG: hypothetical protein KF902_06640 [Phycisphaeraceae bacterium]|nr:hypothetical protein [Phycisphaeraceae bacterium]
MLRLPIKHLHRAFPELDGYSDEQCAKFVRAARGSTRRDRFVRSLVHFLIIAVINVVCFLAGAAFLFWVVGRFFASSPFSSTGPRVPFREAVAVVVICTAVISIGPILGYLARDFLVIDRIRWILRSRGMCATCRYSLVGLAVSPDNRVTCPECATQAEVDASLGELTTDEAGRPRFRPDVAEEVKAPLVARTPDWVKTLLRIARTACGALLVLVVLGLLAGEAFLRIQAANVRKTRPTAATLRAHLEAGQPPGTSMDDPDAVEVAARLLARINETEQLITRRHRETSDSVPSIVFWYVGMDDARLAEVATDVEDARLARLFTIECLRAMEGEGVYELASEFAACRRVWGDVPDPVDLEHVYANSIDRLFLANVFRAKAHLAIEDRDAPGFVRAIEGLLATIRVTSMQFGLTHRFYCSQLELWAYALINEAVLADILNGETAGVMLDVMEVQSYRPPISWNAEWDRLLAHMEISSTFESAARLRLGPWSSKGKKLKERYSMTGTPANGRIGTYDANIRAVDAIHRYAKAALDASEHEEAMSLAVARPGPTGLIIPDFRAGFPIDRLIWLEVQNALDREGMRLVLCLERYRAAHGRIPERLDELVPEFIDQLPRDVWGGGPLGYVRVDPLIDPFGRSFLVYSIGADGTDDGGKMIRRASERQRLLWAPVPPELQGFDYIINTPNRDAP